MALSPGLPTVISPLPFFTLLFAFIYGEMTALLPPVAFCLWGIHQNPPAMGAETSDFRPRRSAVQETAHFLFVNT
jgi:hypothetical protein